LGIAKTLVGSFLDLKTELTTCDTSGELNMFVEVDIVGIAGDDAQDVVQRRQERI
jgi:hypothetical protein